MSVRSLGTAAIGLSILALAAPARADETTVGRRATDAHEKDQPHTSAEANGGVLLLPGALVCPTSVNSSTCSRGEVSLAASLQNLYRFGAFGFGAGIMFATTLRSDAANGDPSIGREHTRSYFLVEGVGRYYFLRSRSWDFWAGVTAGLVVLNDSWTSNADRDPYEMTAKTGPEANTLGTEGFTAGLGLGAEWSFLHNWSFGPVLHYSNWILPNQRQMTPTLDVASLAGRLDVIDVAVHLTYRISL
jgi:hypothetical protein